MYHSGLICLTWGMATATSPAFSAFWESIKIYSGTRIYTKARSEILSYSCVITRKVFSDVLQRFPSYFLFCVVFFVSVVIWYNAWASASLISSQRCSCSVSQAWRGAAVLWDPSVSFSLCALCSHISSCETPGRNTHISESRSC